MSIYRHANFFKTSFTYIPIEGILKTWIYEYIFMWNKILVRSVGMGFYSKYIYPKIIEAALSIPSVMKNRKEILLNVTGDILERNGFSINDVK